MKKFTIFALMTVLIFTCVPVICAEGKPNTQVPENAQSAPVVSVKPADPDAETLRAAWNAVKDTHKDLADKLSKIWDGERTGAYETLIATAKVIKVSNPDLAILLEELAKKRSSESKPAK